jgi:hypothetical protein
MTTAVLSPPLFVIFEHLAYAIADNMIATVIQLIHLTQKDRSGLLGLLPKYAK